MDFDSCPDYIFTQIILYSRWIESMRNVFDHMIQKMILQSPNWLLRFGFDMLISITSSYTGNYFKLLISCCD